MITLYPMLSKNAIWTVKPIPCLVALLTHNFLLSGPLQLEGSLQI